MTHPWHLRGMPMRVVARDGYPLGSAAFLCDTLVVQETTADTSQVTGGPVAAAARAAGSTAVTCQIPISG